MNEVNENRTEPLAGMVEARKHLIKLRGAIQEMFDGDDGGHLKLVPEDAEALSVAIHALARPAPPSASIREAIEQVCRGRKAIAGWLYYPLVSDSDPLLIEDWGCGGVAAIRLFASGGEEAISSGIIDILHGAAKMEHVVSNSDSGVVGDKSPSASAVREDLNLPWRTRDTHVEGVGEDSLDIIDACDECVAVGVQGETADVICSMFNTTPDPSASAVREEIRFFSDELKHSITSVLRVKGCSDSAIASAHDAVDLVVFKIADTPPDPGSVAKQVEALLQVIKARVEWDWAKADGEDIEGQRKAATAYCDAIEHCESVGIDIGDALGGASAPRRSVEPGAVALGRLAEIVADENRINSVCAVQSEIGQCVDSIKVRSLLLIEQDLRTARLRLAAEQEGGG